MWRLPKLITQAEKYAQRALKGQICRQSCYPETIVGGSSHWGPLQTDLVINLIKKIKQTHTWDL
jgi:hypothetical protein